LSPQTNTAQQSSSPLDQFLTPEAMLTPGIAGATAMMITNALGTNFAMSRSWTALILSFTFGLLSIVASKPIYTKLLFYILNSLVIFCVASGANNLGQKAQAASLVNKAFAQVSTSEQDVKACADLYSQIASKLIEITNAKSSGQSVEAIKTLTGEYDALAARGKAIPGWNSIGGSNSVVNNPGNISRA
jgi:hypothetical protein